MGMDWSLWIDDDLMKYVCWWKTVSQSYGLSKSSIIGDYTTWGLIDYYRELYYLVYWSIIPFSNQLTMLCFFEWIKWVSMTYETAWTNNTCDMMYHWNTRICRVRSVPRTTPNQWYLLVTWDNIAQWIPMSLPDFRARPPDCPPS